MRWTHCSTTPSETPTKTTSADSILLGANGVRCEPSVIPRPTHASVPRTDSVILISPKLPITSPDRIPTGCPPFNAAMETPYIPPGMSTGRAHHAATTGDDDDAAHTRTRYPSRRRDRVGDAVP